MGKTTIAAALVNDEETRSSFEKIVWVSVGQEPDIRELQDSMHHQLTEQHFPDSVKTDADAMTALRNAAKTSNILLVLDDVWDPKHEKPLNCIDPDNASRLLVEEEVSTTSSQTYEYRFRSILTESIFTFNHEYSQEFRPRRRRTRHCMHTLNLLHQKGTTTRYFQWSSELKANGNDKRQPPAQGPLRSYLCSAAQGHARMR